MSDERPGPIPKHLYSQVDCVLQALGHIEAFVTDWSTVGDFDLDNKMRERASQWLGVPVDDDASIMDLATQIRGEQ